ncbi:DUF4238 domain-containing protein (plasmid) [Sphingomonas sp. AAP5]|uniref:DUF4238 domain-containing protein n=1 Tax=Sphingomonas sp. AAP5 TaxID=1523415 RepID=UPI001056FD99|nr:DUF4238 domain-containing protein [Sphingomonas sp. AAP5]QBM78197.1 DUF4238 domain-containing protein [Sphingomonas sp. AAP5]
MTQSTKQNPSRRHHFIPQFLLREWGDGAGDLVCYWPRGDGKVRSKPLSPKSVAYKDWIYETTGFSAEHAQQMEDIYFKLIDDRASNAHRLLVDGRTGEMSHEMMCDWARFIMSIWFRTPGDVKGLKTVINALSDPAVSEAAIGLTVPDDFPEAALNQLQMEAIRRAIDDPERGQVFLSMEWATITSTETRSFLISDWPLDTAKDLPFLGHPKSYITIPISPRQLFIAAPSRAFLLALGDLQEGELERRQNYATVAQARSFVGASNDEEDAFIKQNFGCEKRPSIARSIAEAWNVEI